MARSAEEMLYLAMEDFRIDIMVGKGAGATSIPLDLAPFTLVGATTRSGLLPNPLRDRFGFTAHLEYYDRGELERVIERSAAMLGVDAAASPAPRSPAAPAAHRASRTACCGACATTVVHGTGARDAAAVDADLERCAPPRPLRRRLDRPRPARPRGAATILVRRFRGGPVGLSTLAVAVGEEAETIESVVEPYLVRIGFMRRTPRGRIATPRRTRTSGSPSAHRSSALRFDDL